jgi:uncharacterized protein (UPF0332 family)
MSFDWSHYLDLAQDLFRQAANSPYEDAYLRSAISRAYYATYHKARLRLYNKWGISVPADASAHSAVRKEFWQKNHKQIAATLDRMRIDRNRADYTDSIANLATTARENIKRANQVISVLSKL